MSRLKVVIVGYGNVGRGVSHAIASAPDAELAGIISRDAARVKRGAPDVPVLSSDDERSWKGLGADVAILCGGSAKDLPEQGPFYGRFFNTVDSFDTHHDIPAYFSTMDETAKKAGKVAIISTGWDPGIFSLERVLADAFVPGASHYTFWGKGVSQGHSDAARHVKGVKDARQYTIPVQSALERVRAGENPSLTTRERHTRLCYVVAEHGADKAAIEREDQGDAQLLRGVRHHCGLHLRGGDEEGSLHLPSRRLRHGHGKDGRRKLNADGIPLPVGEQPGGHGEHPPGPRAGRG